MICLNKFVAVLGMTLVLVVAVFTFSCNAAETVVISFEKKEGFPAAAPGSSFDDLTTNDGVVTWTVRNPEGANYTWVTAAGPGPDPAAPISGTQIGVLGTRGGIGISFGAMNLNKKANLTLNSFYWAYRGQGDSKPGGKAYLEVEYFDLNDKSVGKDRFQGGLNPDFTPKFDLAKASPQFQKIALSKVVFSGVPEIPADQHGMFYLDDVTLSALGKNVTTPTESNLSKSKQVDTTPPMVILPASPDSTVKGEPLYLVKDGQAVSTIVVSRISTQSMTEIIQQDPDNPVKFPKDADAWTTLAALWLQGYIRKATGAELKIVSEDELPTGTIISVGHTQLAAKAGVDARDLKYDGCKTIVKENVLYLLGRDAEKPLGRLGPHGTCRAVLMFLEDHCGVRWFLPTPEGEIIQQVKDISAPRNLTKSFVPAFAYEDGRAAYSPGFHGVGGWTPASIINNFRMGIPALAGGHTYYYAVPSGIGEYKDRGGGKGYFKDHPEYFAFTNGKRTAGEGNSLCSTNPDVKNLLVRWVQERFDEGYEWVSLGQEDGYIRCECPECEKLDNWRYGADREAPAERLFLLHKAVIDEVAKSHPDKKVILFCYVPTAWPSKKIDYFGDNCIVQLCSLESEFIKAWRGKAGGMVGYVAYWFSIQQRMGVDIHATPREVAEKIRYLHDNGFMGLTNWAETGWGFQGPCFYTLGKMMGDPSLDYKALVENYCRGVYGNAASTMLEFFNLLYARHEEVLPLPVEDFFGVRDLKMPPWITTTELYVMEYPLSFLNQLEQLLQKAEAEADTERARGWVRLTRDDFDFAKLLTHALVSYRAYQASPTKENWLELKQRVEAFDAYRMKIINYPREYTDRWFPGYDYFCIYLTGNLENERIHYIPWEKRKPEVLKSGVKGTGIGYRGGSDSSWIKEPLTLDFSVGIQP